MVMDVAWRMEPGLEPEALRAALAEADALIEQARRSTDRPRRAELYRELQRLVQEDAPWVFVASWRQNAVTAADLQGFRLEPSFFLLLRDVHRES